jgi:hypothetical protein
LVKVKLSPSKKKYLKVKHFYDYLRAHLPIPQRFFDRLEPYFNEDFQAELAEDSNKITLTYTIQKKKNQKQPPT